MGGVLYQMGERVPSDLQDIAGLRLWTRRLMRANEVNPDPNTALVVATSVMLGLVARQRSGVGQQVLIDMFGANAYANHDDFLSYPGKPSRAMPDAELLGLNATYRLYQCAEDQWVFLALTNQQEHNNFIQVLKEHNLQAPSPEELSDGGSGAIEALAQLFAQHNATFWETLLTSAGIGCVRADRLPPSEFWLQDTQVKALGLTAEVEHPSWGAYRRHGAMVFFDGKTQELAGPPLAGQHNAELLRQHGYDDEQIAQLQADGVLWSESP